MSGRTESSRLIGPLRALVFFRGALLRAVFVLVFVLALVADRALRAPAFVDFVARVLADFTVVAALDAALLTRRFVLAADFAFDFLALDFLALDFLALDFPALDRPALDLRLADFAMFASCAKRRLNAPDGTKFHRGNPNQLLSVSFTASTSCLSVNGLGRNENCWPCGRLFSNASSA